MDSVPEDEEDEQQKDSQFMGAVSIISTDGQTLRSLSLSLALITDFD